LKWDNPNKKGINPSKKGIKGRNEKITIKGNYKVCWNEYSILNLKDNNSYKKSSNNIYKYALLEVQ